MPLSKDCRDLRVRQQPRLWKAKKPLDIINKYMIPALDFVGHGFEKKTLFLPQLLMSADAAKAAFEVIREAVGVGETQGETVIIATVHGDIHDIGKNIVKVLLENYGYRVLDLGKDVPVEAVVEATKKTDAKVVGLSALMTTTVGAMENYSLRCIMNVTVRLLSAVRCSRRNTLIPSVPSIMHRTLSVR